MSRVDNAPPRTDNKSFFACLATPHTFNPNLGAADALFAVITSLARIFGACFLFALWGGFFAWVWTTIGNRSWRVAAAVPLALLFPVALAGLLWVIRAIEMRMEARG